MKYQPDLEIDTLKDLNLDFLGEVSALEPFGRENEEPILCLKNAQIIDSQAMGEKKNHLKLILKCGSGTIKAIAFFAPKGWFNLDDATPHAFIIKPIVNEFNGTRSCEAHLLDVLE